MKIDFANLPLAYQDHKDEFDEAILSVASQANYIMGEPISRLEESLKSFTGSKHAITCSSGTDALILALMAIDIQPGDEVITTPFTFIATAETIAFLKARPVFVDINAETFNIDTDKIEEKITDKTKAIIPVSLFGQMSDMKKINAIANRHNLFVIEDAAQSFGATQDQMKSCNSSDFGCTSFFPAKPLGCFGDGGAIFTNDDGFASKIRSLRLHGQTQRYYHKYIGIGGRLDTLQAAILEIKLKHYKGDMKNRNRVAQAYSSLLKNDVLTPGIVPGNTSVWAQYSIRVKNRDEMLSSLKKVGIPTAVHYPQPLHLQECFDYLNYKEGDFPVAEKISQEILSLPMNPYLKEEEINYIVEQVKENI